MPCAPIAINPTDRANTNKASSIKPAFTFPGHGPCPSQNQRALNKMLNTVSSPEAFDLAQPIQIDRQDRQRISAEISLKTCLQLRIRCIFQS
jgi:hypothetical protein